MTVASKDITESESAEGPLTSMEEIIMSQVSSNWSLPTSPVSTSTCIRWAEALQVELELIDLAAACHADAQ